MNRLSTLVIIGFAALLAGCGSSTTSSTQPPKNVTYSVNVTPDRLSLNAGDHSGISATVDESILNSAPKPVSPAGTIQFLSSSSLVSVSPAGQVCAGSWDVKFELCTPTAELPPNPVTITAYNNQHNVSGSTQVFIHRRAANITLSAPSYPSAHNCVSQNQSVTYIASAVDSTGAAIPNCANSNVAGCIDNLDYSWSTADSNVAGAGLYGGVVARNPGVTSVYAKLNGTVSVPQAFATCPPAAIVLASSAYTKGVPTPPFSTADLNTLQKGSTQYLTAYNVVDTNGNVILNDLNGTPLNTLSLSFLSSDLLTGSFTSLDSFTSRFTANTSGRTILSASCTPPTCNPSISDFVAPNGTLVTAKSLGYGYPTYSNVIGATVTGSTGSTVLVTGDVFPNASSTTCQTGQVCPHVLLTYDTESLAQTHQIEIPNLPNSLVVAPNGTKAYIGSDEGLVVVDLTSFQSSILTYPIVGDPISTDQITGKVLGVSPDSRYVLISDIANGLVYLVDTTVAKSATRYTIPNIRAVTFAADGYDFWIGGDAGVYVYQADTFVPIANGHSSAVTAVAWTADGQSYFASGNGNLDAYSTCDDAFIKTTNGGGPVNLSSTAIDGTNRVFGFATTQWLDYSVTSSSKVGTPVPVGNVCLSSVAVNAPAATPSTLKCTAQQFSFSPRLEQEFITGVSSTCATPETVIHGYDLGSVSGTPSEILLTTSTTSTPTFTPVPIVPLSGGVLSDGRKLYVGTWDSTNSALLRRFDLASGTEDVVTIVNSSNAVIGNSVPASLPLVPSFVAVVPK